MLKISIITINYNNLDGLVRTVESVVNQTWREFEYIVVDGGSTDGSAEYIESQSDKIDYWVSEPDKGIYNAMNKGIVKATGEYLLFLNSGDWLVDTLVIEDVRSHFNDAAVIYGNQNKVYPTGEVIIDKGIAGNTISLRSFVSGNLNHQSTFINKKLFEKYGLYDETLKIVADWKLFLVACGLNIANVIYVDRIISNFDMTGLCTTNKGLLVEERKQVLESLIPTSILTDINRLIQLEQLVQSKDYKNFQKVWSSTYLRRLNIIALRLLRFFKFDH